MRKYFTLVLLICTSFLSQAQMPKTFPVDDAGFLQAFTGMFTATNRADARETAAQFTVAYNSITLSPAAKEQVKKTAILMLEKKAQIFPVFDRFAKLVVELSKATANTAIIEQSLSMLPRILEGSTAGNFQSHNKYIEFISTFHGTGSILASSTRAWRFNGTAKVTWETDQPVVQFSKGTLTAATKGDSIQILETSGDYLPLTDDWRGKEGKITWARAGLDAANVYATFKSYNINLQKSEFAIDTVKLTFTPYLKQPLTGSFQDKLFPTIDKNSFNYPRFASFDDKIVIDQLSKEVRYEGGFGLEGSQIMGTGSGAERAVVTILDPAGNTLMTAKAYRFFIRNFQEISSTAARISINYRGGRLDHPSTNFNYNTKTRKVRISKGDGIYQRIPYSSSFHQVSIYADALDYAIDSSSVRILPLSVGGESTASIESYDFYIKDMERRYRGVTNYDPLSVLKKYCEDNYVRTLPFDYVPNMLGYAVPRETAERLMYRMTEDGYIHYDPVIGEVEVLQRTFDHIMAAQNIVDFDVIRFDSKVIREHGRLNVKDGLLQMYGVRRIRFSEKQMVGVRLLSDTIVIGENRNMQLNGILSAGKINVYSKDIRFNYKDFKFDLDAIDSFKIIVLDRLPGPEGNYDYVEAKTAISNISGELLIDRDDNKGSSRVYPTYPIFSTKDSSRVIYTSVNEKYNEDKFYFLIYPFEIQELNTMEGEKMTFKGRMHSGGIFEPFESALGIQSDISFGFAHTFPDPVSIFNKSNSFKGNIYLEKDGLSGSGTLTSNAATFAVDTAMYYPDSVFAVVSSISFTEDTKNNTPAVTGETADLIWWPRMDTLLLNRASTPFAMYNGQVDFSGDLKYGKGYLAGKGQATLSDGKLNADRIDLKRKELVTASGNLSISESGAAAPAFTETGLSGTINLETKKGAFRHTRDSTANRLPQLQCLVSAAAYEWDMDNRNLSFLTGNNQKTFAMLMLSPALDSLAMNAGKAVYNLDAGNLQIEGINEIRVADSRVVPEGSKLSVERGGAIGSLVNAQLVMNRDKPSHTVEQATLNIEGRNALSGEGTISFKSGKETFPLKVRDISVVMPEQVSAGKKGAQPVENVPPYIQANAIVEESDRVRLSEKIFYKGKLLLRSNTTELDLEGFGKLDIRSEYPSGWFALDRQLDMQKNILEADSLKNENGSLIYSGIFLDRSDLVLVTQLMQAPGTLEEPILTVSGALRHGPEPGKWYFGQPETVAGTLPQGTMLTFREENGEVEAFGEFTPGFDFQEVKMKAIVQAKRSNQDAPYEFAMAIGFNFLLDQTIWDKLAKDIQEKNAPAQTANLKANKFLQRAIFHMFPVRQYALDQSDNLLNNGTFIPGTGWGWPLFISDLKMQWDQIEGSYKAVGPATIVMMGNRQINQRVKCFLEMGYRRGADYFNLYFETSGGAWYFFTYAEGQMYTYSSDESYNNAVGLIKVANRTITRKKEMFYIYDIGNPGLKNIFVERMNSYLESMEQN
jgi:hypothetical protein